MDICLFLCTKHGRSKIRVNLDNILKRLDVHCICKEDELKKLWPAKSRNSFVLCLNGVDDPDKILDIMNSHFANIGDKMASQLAPPADIGLDIEANDVDGAFFLTEVNESVVSELLKELKPSKSCGIDGLTARLLKDCKLHIVPPILHIFNLSLSTSVFPSAWKTSLVTPLFKIGKRDDANNYRPISLLSLISKLFKRIVDTQLYEFCRSHQILCDNQAEFRKGHSRSSCLLDFLDGIYTDIENQ